MRTQEEIQSDMTEIIVELSKRKVTNPNGPFENALKEHIDIKTKWDALLTEAEKLRSKGLWLFSSR
jgi:hypothetical protein